jgi:hypothetical protein
VFRALELLLNPLAWSHGLTCLRLSWYRAGWMSGLIRVDELCGERPDIAGIRRVHFTSLGGLVGTMLSPQINSWKFIELRKALRFQ